MHCTFIVIVISINYVAHSKRYDTMHVFALHVLNRQADKELFTLRKKTFLNDDYATRMEDKANL